KLAAIEGEGLARTAFHHQPANHGNHDEQRAVLRWRHVVPGTQQGVMVVVEVIVDRLHREIRKHGPRGSFPCSKPSSRNAERQNPAAELGAPSLAVAKWRPLQSLRSFLADSAYFTRGGHAVAGFSPGRLLLRIAACGFDDAVGR